jgi:hypothetical protein
MFGQLYTDQSKLDEAEEMYMRVLKGYEKALGVEHTSTLGTSITWAFSIHLRLRKVLFNRKMLSMEG